MESAGDTKHTRIQVKHAAVTAIIIVSTLSLIASIVLLTIGYMNQFGTVGLGMLGGGCVLYFLTIIFLCSTSICVKNRYYPDEVDLKEKLSLSASEDIFLLKPASNVTSPGNNEVGRINETERRSDNMIPLYSVSTVSSSDSSSVSTDPDRAFWHEGDAEGALDCDVFSSSLTGDIKLQEKLKFKWGSMEQMNSESPSECKIKDLEKRNNADGPVFHSNGKSMADTPRQRKPVVIDFLETTYSSTGKSQLMNQHISGQSKDESNINTITQICGRNNMSEMLRPMEGLPRSAAQSKHPQHMAKQVKHMHIKKETN